MRSINNLFSTVLLAILPTATSAYAKCTTQVEMNQCATAEYKKSDLRLNQVYQSALKKIPHNKQLLLREAQRKWVTYRDAQCEKVYEDNAEGSIANLERINCLKILTDAQASELSIEFLKKPAVCGGKPLPATPVKDIYFESSKTTEWKEFQQAYCQVAAKPNCAVKLNTRLIFLDNNADQCKLKLMHSF